jgi:glucose-6-phosphate 1-dehydrogenase
MTTVDNFDMVLFGGTGDLVMRKLLPALYHQHQAGNLAAHGRIICLGRHIENTEAYLAKTTPVVQGYLGSAWSSEHWQSFCARLLFLRLDATEPNDYKALAQVLNEEPHRVRVFYLATAPTLFAQIAQSLAGVKLNGAHSRVVLEKPLGHDLESSTQINEAVGKHFRENQIYRIDHYLGKEAVQNLLALRFANTFLEPLWRRTWIRDVQITVMEKVGVESRGTFYDKVGALRDMVQSHLLQLLCITTMEPPASMDSDAVRDEKTKILRSLRPFTKEDVMTKAIRGQYRAGTINGKDVPAYLDEQDIPADSTTETFVSLKAEIETWRWAGVPFYLRTGKRMQDRIAEIVINFRETPTSIFGRVSEFSSSPNRLVIRLQPDESVRLYLLAKEPGDKMNLRPVHLDLDFKESFKTRSPEAYERLLLDVIRGNLALFMRRDELEAAWKWVEPILDTWAKSTEAPKPYNAGTWGPAASTVLLSRDGNYWHEEI